MKKRAQIHISGVMWAILAVLGMIMGIIIVNYAKTGSFNLLDAIANLF